MEVKRMIDTLDDALLEQGFTIGFLFALKENESITVSRIDTQKQADDIIEAVKRQRVREMEPQ